ncbi:MAG: oxidoreductase [Phycisphaerales bacterium]|nr:MAG: oxidoreductase [Phycisphaerales bacterium]
MLPSTEDGFFRPPAMPSRIQGRRRDRRRYPPAMPTITLPQLHAPTDRPAQDLPAGFLQALRKALRGQVRVDVHDRMLYATDASSYQVPPLAVVIPADEDDVVQAAAIASDFGVPILPRGGGTSLAGQCVNNALVIDTSAALTAVRSVDPQARRCVVQAGITIDDLNAAIAPTGLFFAPDPSTSRQANIGGCIGNNAAGARSIRYGRTVENLHAIDACLADGTLVRFEPGSKDPVARRIARDVLAIVAEHRGEIRRRYPKTLRRNAGYALDLVLDDLEHAERTGQDPLDVVNLARLLCGSEGTLAITLGAELHLHPLPRAKGLVLLGYADLDRAIEAVAPLLETNPAAVELVDDVIIDLALANRAHRASAQAMPQPTGGPLRAVLYVEYFADSQDQLRSAMHAGRDVATAHDPTAGHRLIEHPADMADAWALRKAGEPLLHGIVSNRKPVTFVEDNAVPVEHLGQWVRRFRQIVQAHGTFAAFYAHASVGVLHVRPMLDPRSPADEAAMHAIAVQVADLAKELGGVMSGEHGDGRVRGPLLERFFGPRLMHAFARVKHAFDPAGLLNPGIIANTPGDVATITQRTRVRPGRSLVDVPPVATYFDYADQHGLRGAVEMCNGAGVCRKKTGGVMCPSYMATLDERHSTRGRGNALRLAITGQLPGTDDDPWSDPQTIQTLNLCLSCKACKSECPSNVDVARLKAEYTAQRFATRGRPSLQALAFGHVRTLNRLGSLAPSIANALAGSALGRKLAKGLLNIDPRRSLPPFARSLKAQWHEATDTLDAPAPDAPRVLVMADCFTTYNEPHIGIAAAKALMAFGYRPVLIDAGCCGRAMISTGLLESAVRTVERTCASLSADPDAPIVVLEPSCLSAITDDWLLLRTAIDPADRKALASRAWSLEAFLEAHWDRHPRRPQLPGDEPSSGRPAIYLHGHCHDKALRSFDPAVRLLQRFAQVHTADTTCCGMAGSFGFTSDRYDLSMKIGRLGALPRAEQASRMGQPVLAAGTSCRHQMLDGAGLHALHPAQWLCQVLHGAQGAGEHPAGANHPTQRGKG